MASICPLGSPVVPEVYMMMATSCWSIATARPAAGGRAALGRQVAPVRRPPGSKIAAAAQFTTRRINHLRSPSSTTSVCTPASLIRR